MQIEVGPAGCTWSGATTVQCAERPTVVLVHGGRRTATPTSSPTSHGSRTMPRSSSDLRDHGRSARMTRDWTFEACADDVPSLSVTSWCSDLTANRWVASSRCCGSATPCHDGRRRSRLMHASIGRGSWRASRARRRARRLAELARASTRSHPVTNEVWDRASRRSVRTCPIQPVGPSARVRTLSCRRRHHRTDLTRRPAAAHSSARRWVGASSIPSPVELRETRAGAGHRSAREIEGAGHPVAGCARTCTARHVDSRRAESRLDLLRSATPRPRPYESSAASRSRRSCASSSAFVAP